MKYRIVLAISLFALGAGSYITILYREKEQDIQRETSYAEKHNNQSRINGPNKALSEVRTSCINNKLCANHQKRIVEQKDKTTGRQRNLVEAKQEGDADKVVEREHKLAEAQQELKEFGTRDY